MTRRGLFALFGIGSVLRPQTPKLPLPMNYSFYPHGVMTIREAVTEYGDFAAYTKWQLKQIAESLAIPSRLLLRDLNRVRYNGIR